MNCSMDHDILGRNVLSAETGAAEVCKIIKDTLRLCVFYDIFGADQSADQFPSTAHEEPGASGD